jgi:hypothetical protein
MKELDITDQVIKYIIDLMPSEFTIRQLADKLNWHWDSDRRKLRRILRANAEELGVTVRWGNRIVSKN